MLTSKKRKLYPNENLVAAVKAVKSRKLNMSMASRKYSVPRKTLSDRVKNLVGETPGPAPMLTSQEENDLADHMSYLIGQGFPLTRSIARSFIKSFVQNMGKPALFNLENGPSDQYFRKFYQRHPELQEQRPQRGKRNKSSVSNTKVLNQYFTILDKTLSKLNLKNRPGQIFNVDEIEFSGKECLKQKGTSAKDDHMVATVCISADGKVLPTFITFQKSFPRENYTKGVPSGWLFGMSDTGNMDGNIFVQWFKRIFIPNCGRKCPVLLLLDNYESHIQLEVVQLARENNIQLLNVPTRTSHILQPLDVAVFRPLKEHFVSKTVELGFVTSQKTMRISSFPYMLSCAIDQCCPPERIKDAFEKTGIVPFSPNTVDKSMSGTKCPNSVAGVCASTLEEEVVETLHDKEHKKNK